MSVRVLGGNTAPMCTCDIQRSSTRHSKSRAYYACTLTGVRRGAASSGACGSHHTAGPQQARPSTAQGTGLRLHKLWHARPCPCSRLRIPDGTLLSLDFNPFPDPHFVARGIQACMNSLRLGGHALRCTQHAAPTHIVAGATCTQSCTGSRPANVILVDEPVTGVASS